MEADICMKEDDGQPKRSNSPKTTNNTVEEEMTEIQNHLHGADEVDEVEEMIKESNNLECLMNEDNADGLHLHHDQDKLNQNGQNEFDNEMEEQEQLQQERGEESDEDEETDEEEDDVQITIGDIDFKTPPAGGYINLNLTKGNRSFGQQQSTNSTSGSSSSQAKNLSKSALDLDAVGTYNGIQIYDVNIDSIEDKPWRKPGSDITDYFNYGFNEETWKLYCERQRKMRLMNQNGQMDLTITGKAFDQRSDFLIGKSNDVMSAMNDTNSKYQNTNNSILTIGSQQPMKKPNVSNTMANNNRKHPIDVIGSNTPATAAPPNLPPLPPPPPHHPLLGSRPSLPSNATSQSDNANSISVLGVRPPAGLPFPPPPSMQMPPPPFGFPPPPDAHFASTLRPPMGILPPPPPHLAPNGQSLAFGGGAEFAPPPPPHAGLAPPRVAYPPPPHVPGSGILPHPSDQRSYEDYDDRRARRLNEDYEQQRDSRSSYRSSERHDYEERPAPSSSTSSSRHSNTSSYRDRDRDRDDRSDRSGSDRNRKERNNSRERSRDRQSSQHESSSSRNTRSINRSDRGESSSHRKEKDKDRDRSDRSDHRDRDRDNHHRERESHRDKESKSSKSASSSKHSSSESSEHHKHRSSHSSSSSKSKSSSSKSSRNKESSGSRKDSENSDKAH